MQVNHNIGLIWKKNERKQKKKKREKKKEKKKKRKGIFFLSLIIFSF